MLTLANPQLDVDLQLVRRLCSIDHGLSRLETRFVDTVAKQVQDEERPLNKKQRELAVRIIGRGLDRPLPPDYLDDL